MNGGCENAYLLPCRYGQGQLADHFSCMAGYDGSTEDFTVLPVEMDRGDSLTLTISDGAVIVAEFLREGSHLDTCRARLGFIVPYMSDFRIGVGTPRYGQGTRFTAPEE